jgi:dihydroorotase
MLTEALTEATTLPLDLLLTGSTVVDPSQGLHARKEIGIAQGRIALVEDSIPTARARQAVDCSGLIVTPGLVDLHVHVYEGASHYGIEVDSTCGAWTFAGFRRQVLDVAQTKVYALLNLSTTGMISPIVGELEDIRNADRSPGRWPSGRWARASSPTLSAQTCMSTTCGVRSSTWPRR